VCEVSSALDFSSVWRVLHYSSPAPTSVPWALRVEKGDVPGSLLVGESSPLFFGSLPWAYGVFPYPCVSSQFLRPRRSLLLLPRFEEFRFSRFGILTCVFSMHLSSPPFRRFFSSAVLFSPPSPPSSRTISVRSSGLGPFSQSPPPPFSQRSFLSASPPPHPHPRCSFPVLSRLQH